MSHYANTGGRNINPSWPEFIEHQADLERAERAASGESRPTFLPPSALATSAAQFTEQYDPWMAKRLHMTVEELRESRARARARDAKEAAAAECEIEIVDEL